MEYTGMTAKRTKIDFICIPYIDSDFYNTTYNLLLTIVRVVKWQEYFEFETLTRIIKEGIGWHYFAFQHNDVNFEDISHIEKHLSTIKILFNKDACNETLTNHFGEGWFVDINQGTVTKF